MCPGDINVERMEKRHAWSLSYLSQVVYDLSDFNILCLNFFIKVIYAEFLHNLSCIPYLVILDHFLRENESRKLVCQNEATKLSLSGSVCTSI